MAGSHEAKSTINEQDILADVKARFQGSTEDASSGCLPIVGKAAIEKFQEEYGVHQFSHPFYAVNPHISRDGDHPYIQGGRIAESLMRTFCLAEGSASSRNGMFSFICRWLERDFNGTQLGIQHPYLLKDSALIGFAATVRALYFQMQDNPLHKTLIDTLALIEGVDLREAFDDDHYEVGTFEQKLSIIDRVKRNWGIPPHQEQLREFMEMFRSHLASEASGDAFCFGFIKGYKVLDKLWSLRLHV